MGTTSTRENKRPIFEIPVWRGTEQVQEQDAAKLMLAQEQDIAEQEQGVVAPISALSAQEQDVAAPIPAQEQGSAEEAQTPPNVIHRKRQAVPIQEKVLLTIDEAAEYTGIGLHKLRELSNGKSCTFVLWNGSKRMFKRRKLDEYLEEAYSI